MLKNISNNLIALILFIVLLALSIFIGSRALAGEATLNGYAELQVAPEYAVVTVTVTSECFSSASLVSAANDEVAGQVLNLLQTLAASSDPNDVVTANGGYVKRYTGYSARLNTPICVNTFRKENQLSLKTFALKDFAKTFAALQDKIYNLGMSSDPRDNEKPMSFLEIGIPRTGIGLQNQKNYERQVLAMALQDAKEKFAATLTLANVRTYRIVNYSEFESPFHSISEDTRKSIAEMPSPNAPIEFENLTISKRLRVQFYYEGGDLAVF